MTSARMRRTPASCSEMVGRMPSSYAPIVSNMTRARPTGAWWMRSNRPSTNAAHARERDDGELVVREDVPPRELVGVHREACGFRPVRNDVGAFPGAGHLVLAGAAWNR